MLKQIKVGYLCSLAVAPLLVAREKTFTAHADLRLIASQELGLAPMVQKLQSGQLDAAVVPPSFPFALAAKGGWVDIKVVMALGFGGKRVVASNEFHRCMHANDRPEKIRFASSGGATADRYYVEQCLTALGFGEWLGQLEAVPVAATQYTSFMKQGLIDVTVAVEPWPSWSAYEGIGKMLVCGRPFELTDIARVLVVRNDWLILHNGHGEKLLAGLRAASAWAEDPENELELATILARECRELDESILLQILQALRRSNGGHTGFSYLRHGTKDTAICAADRMVAWQAFSRAQYGAALHPMPPNAAETFESQGIGPPKA